MKKTGGNWDPRAWPTYFAASSPNTLRNAISSCPEMLVAVNELKNDEDHEILARMLKHGTSVLIDSGVFWLSTQHAKAHSLTMDQALSLAPDSVDNFTWLFDKYVALIRAIGDAVWGYIEIDQGGRENKIKTRARLEAMGLRPIPVYHPFNDGWDYFDFLAQNYDRICFGNVVQADTETRKRLVATAWERRKKYPHLWIHVLGLTPNEKCLSYPLPSSDSSTWIAGPRWGVHDVMVANKKCWDTGRGFIYDREAHAKDESGRDKAVKLAGYEAHMRARTQKTIFAEQLEALGYHEDFWKGDS